MASFWAKQISRPISKLNAYRSYLSIYLWYDLHLRVGIVVGKKILLIDDSEDMRILMRMLFKPEGYEIDEATDGQQALEMLDTEFVPDLIFLDYNMAGMDGPEFLKVLEKKFPRIFAAVPVILLTGMDSESVTDTGATEVIAKTSGIEPLLQIVTKYLH